MTDVIRPDFGKKEEDPEGQYMEGPAVCMNCRHEWHGVAPAGMTEMECPSCGTRKGVFSSPSFRDEPHWQCNCGNEFFVIHEDAFVCAHCGTQQRFP